jgi:hypothetical protein
MLNEREVQAELDKLNSLLDTIDGTRGFSLTADQRANLKNRIDVLEWVLGK